MLLNIKISEQKLPVCFIGFFCVKYLYKKKINKMLENWPDDLTYNTTRECVEFVIAG